MALKAVSGLGTYAMTGADGEPSTIYLYVTDAGTPCESKYMTWQQLLDRLAADIYPPES